MSELTERLDASRQALMDAIAAMDDQAFRARPQPGEWSVAQVLAHLFIIETMLIISRQPLFDEDEADDPEAALVRRLAVPQLIHGLVAQRRANLQKLEALTGQGHLSVDKLESFAAHEEEHAGQITELRRNLPAPTTAARGARA